MKEFAPVHITMVLRDSQMIDSSRWQYTFDGEQRQAPYKRIEFYAMSIEDAIHKIKYDEIYSITIDATFEQ